MITGTVRSAVNLQLMDSKWQQKKNDISKNQKQKEMTAEERTIAQFQEQMDKERESNSHTETYNKLKSGGKLTSEEVQYLQEHDPEALAKYREAQAQKKAYENELKNCKTKEEVQQAKMNKLGNFVSEAKAIVNDPYIPKAKKLELMNQLNNKVCMIAEAHDKFTESTQYRDMPTEQELSEEMKAEAAEALPEEMKAEEEEALPKEMKASAEEILSETVRDAGTGKESKNTDLTETVKRTADSPDKPEELLRKKFRPQRKDSGSKQNTDFDKVSGMIKNFVISEGSSEGKIDICL